MIRKVNKLLIALCIASTPSMMNAQELVKGMYVSAFERSDFIPCGADEHWWLTGDAYSDIEKFIHENKLRRTEDDWYPNVPVYLEVRGTKSKKGEWGHLGAYQRELSTIKLVLIKVDGSCAGN